MPNEPVPVRHAVFISSTYVDLKKERQNIAKAIQKLECIPIGMELFVADDDDQFESIQRQIDLCDYYLLIIGHRYGSLASDGKSFTEKEFEYAVLQEIPVIVMECVAKDPPVSKTDENADLKKKLEKFKKRARKGRMVAQWNGPDDLYLEAITALSQMQKNKPRPGWVRNTSSAHVEPVQTFETQDEQMAFFKGRLAEASTVYDLTWAKARTVVQAEQDEISEKRENYLDSISDFSSVKPYKEIFIFSDGYRDRSDRLRKLHFHYQRAKKGTAGKYSCGFFPEMQFPRLQYTLIDGNDILFTSGTNERIHVNQKQLASVFSNYFDAAWEEAHKLIVDGEVVDEDKINVLLDGYDPS